LIVRAGAQALTLLSAPLNVDVLTALEQGPHSLIDLRRAIGAPPQTTMRGQLRTLTQLGVLEPNRRAGFPGAVDYELARPGHELLEVARILWAWLAAAPDGPVQPGSVAAKSAIKALVEGWSSAIIRALAARPLSLTDLSRVITSVSYPSLERRLTAMRLSGQIEKLDVKGSKRPYSVTSWLRRSVGPLAAATQWERRAVPERTNPFGRFDAEAVFLLSTPLVSLDEEFSGSGRLAVEFGSGDLTQFSGVMVEIEKGRAVSCVSRLEGSPDVWAVGSPSAWLDALIDGRFDRLELGGEYDHARTLLQGFHCALFTNTT
jgi:DNA-binding HxlR family transcriptional regulator